MELEPAHDKPGVLPLIEPFVPFPYIWLFI